MYLFHWVPKATLALSFALCGFGPALAADNLDQQQFEERFSGAVSELNGKIAFGYIKSDFDNVLCGCGPFESASGHFVQGVVSMPLSGQFGLQIDAGYLDTTIETIFPTGRDFSGAGVGGHLFWRDASVGLLGIYGDHVKYDLGPGGATRRSAEVVTTRLGAEAEVYSGQITFKGFIGMDKLDHSVFGSDDFTAGSAEVDFYMTDNVMLKAGFDHSFDRTSAKVGFETMWDEGGVAPTLFADASFNDGETAILGGLKFYLGRSSKSLKQRHREDDPDIDLFNTFGAIGACLNDILAGGPGRGTPTLNGCEREFPRRRAK